jgi:radical SAM protein with 4Fe4S-binding SPASM domain
VTDLCNLRCAHCYQEGFGAGSDRSIEELFRVSASIFESLPERQISVNVTGGEPFVFSHLEAVLEHLHQFENLAELNIITNGTVIKKRQLEKIGSLPKIRYLKVSLEAGDEETNDRIRGRGYFEKVRRNLPIFRELSGKSVVLMMTLGKYNLDAIENTVDFARSEGLSGIIFERFIPLGRGQGIGNQVLDSKDWKRAVEAVSRAAGFDGDMVNLLPYRGFWLGTGSALEDHFRGALCNLGDESMALMPDGTVFPCRRLEVPVGNLLEDPFEHVLKKLGRFAPSQIKGRLRGELCAPCPVDSCCGCRAVANVVGDGIFADDNQCLFLSH